MSRSDAIVRSAVGYGVALVVAAATCGALPAAAQDVPRYELDPLWPRLPFGERWLTGGLGGMCVGGGDRVLILNRQNVVPGDLDGARLAPPVVELGGCHRVACILPEAET